MTDSRIPRELESLVAEADAEASNKAGRPDFQDVLARAGRIAPHRFSEPPVEPDAAMGGTSVQPPGPLGPLDDFTHDAREFVSQRVESRKSEPLPALPRPPRRRRVGWAIAGGLAAAAALVFAAVQIGPELSRRAARAHEGAYSEAPRSAEMPTTDGLSIEVSPRERPGTVAEPESPAEPEVSDVVGVEPDEDDVEEAGTDGAETGGPGRRRTSPRASMDERLADLDRKAREAWRAGRTDQAYRAFAKLIRIGGRRALVDVAFGDMFSLAKQSGRRGELERLWKSYLRRFPRGRYVDEARAGLCRRHSGARQRTCWQQYLDEAPRKTYEAEARRALEP